MSLARLALNVLAAFLLLLGFIWVLQGTNILPRMFMTREPIWAARRRSGARRRIDTRCD
jgi:hypothetical protein